MQCNKSETISIHSNVIKFLTGLCCPFMLVFIVGNMWKKTRISWGLCHQIVMSLSREGMQSLQCPSSVGLSSSLVIPCSLTGCTSHTLLCVPSLQAALELKGFCVCWPLPLRQDSVFTAHPHQINISPPLKPARAGDSRSLGSLFPCLANNLIG